MSTTCWLVVGVTLCAAVCATARFHVGITTLDGRGWHVVSTTWHVLMVMPSAIMPPSVGHTTSRRRGADCDGMTASGSHHV